jgi:hypothetical protein
MMAQLWGKTYTRAEILRRVGDISQLAEVMPFELVDGNENGVRGVALRNAAGLELTVLTERGMSIVGLTYKGVPLPLRGSVGMPHPAYFENPGLGWLRTWPTGFLTPCGLTQVGSPCSEDGEELGQHGRVASIPAKNVSWGGAWEGDDYHIWVEGIVRETRIFGEDLVLKRRIWTHIDSHSFWIEDRVENLGHAPAPHMFLQHFNLGFPLVDSTTRLELPEHTTQPRDDNARPGVDTYLEFSEPIAGYKEQVFYHDLAAGEDGQVEVRLINPAFDGGSGLGVAWRYNRSEYPVLVEWKQMGEGMYVVGVEPANCHVEGRCAERERGTLVMLDPGEVRNYSMEIRLFNL